MKQANDELISGVRVALGRRANPDRAEPMQAYMKSAMPYYGVPVPQQREVFRTVFPAHPLEDVTEWRATVLALWRQARFREERYAAIALAGERRYRDFRTPAALPVFQELIVTGAWWDLVDGVAIHRIGELLRRYPQPMREVVLGWSRHADRWLRRSAIICQNSFKDATDPDLLDDCIRPNLGDRDFFIRKAIGWALREYAKTNPAWVRRFVREHEPALSPLSRREALKHLGGTESV